MNESPHSLLRQAELLHRQGRRAEAIDLFRQILAQRPELSEGWYELGYLLKREGRYEEALEAYGEALSRKIRRAEEVHLNRAVIYSDHLRRDAQAETELRAALAINPRYVPALLNFGNLREERGDREAALAFYAQVLARSDETDHPYQELCLEALARTANLRSPVDLDDPLLQRLATAAMNVKEPVVQANLLFALGHAYDKLEAYNQAFDAYAKANRSLLSRSVSPYDRAHARALVDEIIKVFKAPNSAERHASKDIAEPLFICGMFRSGSTLIEQVLAAHPSVTSGGELDYLMRLASQRLAPFPASMAAFDRTREPLLAQEYLAHLARLFPKAEAGTYITDKRPDNYLLIGLIKQLFPTAKIIHTTRHPLDTSLSVFMQHLDHRVAGYSSDLSDIGHYYGQYRRLMAHWKSLYPESIYDFDYDAFVIEPMHALRRLFDFLDIEHDDRVIDFHQRSNTVKTASYWQVRRPLYGSASGRWRNYERHLEPLRIALGDAGVAFHTTT